MKKVLYLLLLGLFGATLLFKTASATLAAPGCCGTEPPGGSLEARKCYVTSADEACDSGRNECKPVNGDFNPGTGTDEAGATFAYNPDCFVNIESPEQVRITDFGRLFSGVVAFLLLVAFILAFFFLILGGISWLTSGGDKAAVEAARNKIIAALVGLVIVAATWALFQLVGGAIGFNILGGFEVPRLF